MAGVFSETDSALFLAQMQGVRPLEHLRVECQKRPPRLLRKHQQLQRLHQRHEEHQIEHWWQCQDVHQHTERVHAFAHLYYAHPSVPEKRLNQLRQGNFATSCMIDLHGMTEAQATDCLSQWLGRCRKTRDKFALLIHGKGMGSDAGEPTLKNLVNWWLRNQPQVLAFCSAQEVDGGTGAVYVLFGEKQI